MSYDDESKRGPKNRFCKNVSCVKVWYLIYVRFLSLKREQPKATFGRRIPCHI